MAERRTFEGKTYEWHGGDWPCQLAYRGACKGCPKEANCVNADGSWVPLDPRILALEEENKRLREALEKIVFHVKENRGFDSVYHIAANCGNYASAALSGKEETHD